MSTIIPNTMFRPTVVTIMKKVKSKMVRGMYRPKLDTRGLSSAKIPSAFYKVASKVRKYIRTYAQIKALPTTQVYVCTHQRPTTRLLVIL